MEKGGDRAVEMQWKVIGKAAEGRRQGGGERLTASKVLTTCRRTMPPAAGGSLCCGDKNQVFAIRRNGKRRPSGQGTAVFTAVLLLI